MPDVRLHCVARLLDTLVLSNGDTILCPFLFTGTNTFDRDSLLRPSVRREWGESVSEPSPFQPVLLALASRAFVCVCGESRIIRNTLF